MASADLELAGNIHFKKEHEDDEDGQSGGHVSDGDICRVCRAGSTAERPLFHPCLCTGSIKFIHQDCLVQWLKHSGKEYCELCKHQFEFAPIYRLDMPGYLSIVDLMSGITRETVKNLRHWLHLSFVAFMWLVIVPISIYRIYRFLLYSSLWSIAKFPLDFFSFENLFLDTVYGLVIVLLSLIGFISLVWLKDQLGTGRGPNWLEQDQREVNRIRMQETQNRVSALKQHLEQAGERSRVRQNAPDRVAAAKELSDFYDQLMADLKSMKGVQQNHFGERLDRMRQREMEIMYDLGMSQWKYQMIVKGAREKKMKNLEEWRTNAITKRIETYRKEVGDPKAVPSSWPELDPENQPSDEALGLHWDERVLLQLYSRPPRELGEEERVEMRRELRETREQCSRLVEEHQLYQQKIVRLLSIAEGQEESPEMEDMWDEEKELILKIRAIKKEIKDSQKREQVVVDRQNRVEQARRKEVEQRMNRWYNRLLGRYQDEDPMVVARRRRRNQHQRPNIGQALAGLARDQPPDPARHGDNVDELTWARLLGLDGSFRFLEHVIWMICLNSVLIIGFVYLPYQLGWVTAVVFSLWDRLGIMAWKGVIATFTGYIVASLVIMSIYYGTSVMKFPRMRNVLGMTYVVIKVGIILTVEAIIFPLMCGWWIDICSLSLFGSTLKSRHDSLQSAPGTVMFLHWLAGMIFIFYLASFVMLMREVLRPGVLWFLRNLNDQNFHPIYEMMALPFHRHLRRFMMSCIMFGVCVMVVLLIPSKIIPFVMKTFLPYNLTLTSSVSPIREVQLELILLQFVIPTLLEHGNCRGGLKFVVNHWASIAARIFGLQSYLLDRSQTGGIVVDLHDNVVQEVPYNPNHEGPVYTGPLQVLGPGFAPFKPYLRPPYFYLRLVGFLIYTSVTAIAISCSVLILPVFCGRFFMSLIGMTEPPEIYTAAIGLYLLWLAIRVANGVAHHVSQGAKTLAKQSGIWIVQGMKCIVAGFLLFVVIPLLLGHLVDLLLITPLRVPADRTPIFYPSTEWALGLLHTKCMCGAIWLTNIGFKRTLDQVYQAGLRNLNLTFVTKEVAWPVILNLSLCIAIPYVFFMGALPLLGFLAYQDCLVLYRYCYPSILTLLISVTVITFTFKQLRRLYNHIRDEKYLVGKQLVNYANAQNMSSEEANSISPVEEPGDQ